MSAFDNIKKYSKLRGLSLQEVAIQAGLSKNMIYQYKNINPKLDTLQKIAKVLGVSTDRLLGNDDKLKKREADLADDDVIFTYEGRKIPKEDLEMIKRFMRGKEN